MNAQEFAETIRKKYPGAYDKVDDVTLAKKVVEKYPVYADKVTFEAAGAEQPEKKGMLRKIAESVIDSPALPIAGGVIGGAAGLPLGPGAIATAGAGGAAGEAYRQLGARALGMKAPATSTQAAKDIGIEGLTQAAGEALGLGVIKPVAKLTGKLLKKPAGQLFQIITKMKPEDAATLFKNPKAILPGQMEKASKAWRAAAEKIGIAVDDVSPEMVEILKGDGKAKVFDTFAKISSGEAVTAKEVQIAKQALDSVVMPVAKTVRKNPQVATLNKIRRAFTDFISKESPEMAAANKGYGIAATGQKFKSLFPRNTTGDPAYFRSSALPALFTGAGAMRGDPLEGAMQGAAVAGLSSPLAIGSLIALAGATRGAGPLLRRTATAALADLAKEKFGRE